MKKGILLLCLFWSLDLSAQQRVGVEVSSRLEDLSAAVHFQKLVKSQFLLGGGILLNGRYGMYNYEFPENTVHDPFSFVPSSVQENGTEYYISSYRARSGSAINAVFMSGWLHEFSQHQGLRINLNLRVGMANTQVTANYRTASQSHFTSHRYQGMISFQAISPEIYHTLRQTNKWTFFYGLRLPVYFSIFQKSYSPQYHFDIYKKPKLEVAIGLTRQVGKGKVQKSTTE